LCRLILVKFHDEVQQFITISAFVNMLRNAGSLDDDFQLDPSRDAIGLVVWKQNLRFSVPTLTPHFVKPQGSHCPTAKPSRRLTFRPWRPYTASSNAAFDVRLLPRSIELIIAFPSVEALIFQNIR